MTVRYGAVLEALGAHADQSGKATGFHHARWGRGLLAARRACAAAALWECKPGENFPVTHTVGQDD
jgi:hypothetical protein